MSFPKSSRQTERRLLATLRRGWFGNDGTTRVSLRVPSRRSGPLSNTTAFISDTPVFTEPEVGGLFRAAERHGPTAHLLFLLLFTTGMRLGAAAKMRWSPRGVLRASTSMPRCPRDGSSRMCSTDWRGVREGKPTTCGFVSTRFPGRSRLSSKPGRYCSRRIAAVLGNKTRGPATATVRATASNQGAVEPRDPDTEYLL